MNWTIDDTIAVQGITMKTYIRKWIMKYNYNGFFFPTTKGFFYDYNGKDYESHMWNMFIYGMIMWSMVSP